jgi:hypothetical protein
MFRLPDADKGPPLPLKIEIYPAVFIICENIIVTLIQLSVHVMFLVDPVLIKCRKPRVEVGIPRDR